MSPEARKAALTIAASNQKFTYELYTTFGDNNDKACGITLGLAAVDADAKSKGESQLLDRSTIMHVISLSISVVIVSTTHSLTVKEEVCRQHASW